MTDVAKRTLAVVVTVFAIGVAGVSILQIFGGFFFAYSFWYYVPAICTLVMLPVATIKRRRQRLFVAYSLFGLFFLSYVFRNWRDVEIARQESILLVIVPHVVQLALCLSVLIFAHRQR